MKLAKKRELAQKRKWRIRKKVIGTNERPRVTVCFTNKNIHAQCIDDENGHAGVSTLAARIEHAERDNVFAGTQRVGAVGDPPIHVGPGVFGQNPFDVGGPGDEKALGCCFAIVDLAHKVDRLIGLELRGGHGLQDGCAG